jgi:hypothetical protein
MDWVIEVLMGDWRGGVERRRTIEGEEVTVSCVSAVN